MKIYFAGSIRGGRDDAGTYQSLISFLSAFGEVLTEHVGAASLSKDGDEGLDDDQIHDRDMNWLSACDLVVAEVSTPSLGVGYELGFAVALRKRVLCLHRFDSGRRLSAMIAGSPGIEAASYASLDEAKRIIKGFLEVVPVSGIVGEGGEAANT